MYVQQGLPRPLKLKATTKYHQWTSREIRDASWPDGMDYLNYNTDDRDNEHPRNYVGHGMLFI